MQPRKITLKGNVCHGYITHMANLAFPTRRYVQAKLNMLLETATCSSSALPTLENVSRCTDALLSHEGGRSTHLWFTVFYTGVIILQPLQLNICNAPHCSMLIISVKMVNYKCGHHVFLTIHVVHKIHMVELLDIGTRAVKSRLLVVFWEPKVTCRFPTARRVGVPWTSSCHRYDN